MVDDGSKDNTAEAVARYADPRLRYLPKQNAERGAARNYGLARAGGEYVLFLDSDDRLHPHHLATLHAAIGAQAPRPNFIATKYDFDRDGQRRPSDLAPRPAGPLGLETFIEGNALACNVCVRRTNPWLFPFEKDRHLCAIHAYADGHRGQALRYARRAAPGLGAPATAVLLVRLVLGPRLVGLLKRGRERP